MNQETIDSPEIIHALRVATYWARGQGLELNRLRSGFARLEDALFIPLDPESRQQFADGAGGELTRLHSLRSSSALAYNTFAPWKTDPTRVASVLGGLGPYDALGFEQQYPTGVSSRHPHLDVVLAGGAPPVAVESKFLEIYDEPKPAEFSRRYLAADELWTGLPNLRALAEELAENPWAFQRLGAAQLVKHTLMSSSTCRGVSILTRLPCRIQRNEPWTAPPKVISNSMSRSPGELDTSDSHST
jgi:hypothetical protein